MKKFNLILKAKYKSKKMVNGKWIYDYGDEKRKEKKEDDGKIDINKPFGVVFQGGSIGSKGSGYTDKRNRKLSFSFNSEENAKAKAKKMNKILSPGEKKYYGMKYTSIKVKKRDFENKEV